MLINVFLNLATIKRFLNEFKRYPKADERQAGRVC